MQLNLVPYFNMISSLIPEMALIEAAFNFNILIDKDMPSLFKMISLICDQTRWADKILNVQLEPPFGNSNYIEIIYESLIS